jgi:hypothetical protein
LGKPQRHMNVRTVTAARVEHVEPLAMGAKG